MTGWLIAAVFLIGVWVGRDWAGKMSWRTGVLQGYAYARNPDKQSTTVRADVSAVLCDHGISTKRETIWQIDL
jgi:hypothetical protein